MTFARCAWTDRFLNIFLQNDIKNIQSDHNLKNIFRKWFRLHMYFTILEKRDEVDNGYSKI